jgi:hypothetical protein
MAKFRFTLRRDDRLDCTNLREQTSESWRCIDCGTNTAPGCRGRAELEQAFRHHYAVEETIDDHSEVYMVHDPVWKEGGMGPWDGCLCIGCLEKRLGRKLRPEDFGRDHEFYIVPGTKRLRDRRGCP